MPLWRQRPGHCLNSTNLFHFIKFWIQIWATCPLKTNVRPSESINVTLGSFLAVIERVTSWCPPQLARGFAPVNSVKMLLYTRHETHHRHIDAKITLESNIHHDVMHPQIYSNSKLFVCDGGILFYYYFIVFSSKLRSSLHIKDVFYSVSADWYVLLF